MSKYYSGPEEYRPLSPWAYFGYSILFSIPLIGLIFNIVFCFSSANINRRNYARSFWCVYIFALILIICGALGAFSLANFSDSFSKFI